MSNQFRWGTFSLGQVDLSKECITMDDAYRDKKAPRVLSTMDAQGLRYQEWNSLEVPIIIDATRIVQAACTASL